MSYGFLLEVVSCRFWTKNRDNVNFIYNLFW